MEHKDSLELLSSQLGTGWMIARRAQLGCTFEECACTASVYVVRAEYFQPLDFICAEALGTETLARCVAC